MHPHFVVLALFILYYSFILVILSRSCTNRSDVQHGCNSAIPYKDTKKWIQFYCMRTCFGDGCNRHSVIDITSNATESFTDGFMVLPITSILFLVYFQ